MTTPMTDEELAAIRTHQERIEREGGRVLTAHALKQVLAEVDRLRAENEALSTEAGDQLREAAARTVRAQNERDALRAHNAVLVTEIRFQANRADEARRERDAALARIDAALRHAARLRDSYEHGGLRHSAEFVEGAKDMATYLEHARAMGVGEHPDDPAPVAAAERPSGSDADTGEGTGVPEPHARPEEAVDER